MKKAQVDVWGVLFFIVGAVLGWIISKRMEAGFFIRIMSAGLTGLAGYVIGWIGSNK